MDEPFQQYLCRQTPFVRAPLPPVSVGLRDPGLTCVWARVLGLSWKTLYNRSPGRAGVLARKVGIVFSRSVGARWPCRAAPARPSPQMSGLGRTWEVKSSYLPFVSVSLLRTEFAKRLRVVVECCEQVSDQQDIHRHSWVRKAQAPRGVREVLQDSASLELAGP